MIGTIGSLVQETSKQKDWIISVIIYILACLSTSMLLGTLLGTLGWLLSHISCSMYICSLALKWGLALTGLLAIAYAFSDIGMFRLPRPRITDAVPVTWWRWWKPYGASFVYGASLGLGVMTRLPFGAFYILCIWCIMRGNITYGVMLMGTYGAIRAAMMIPISWGVYRFHLHEKASSERMKHLLESIAIAKVIVASFLVLFGIQLLMPLFL